VALSVTEPWRKVKSPDLVSLAHEGIEFRDRIQIEKRTEESRDAA
jgi:hypothetical protein